MTPANLAGQPGAAESKDELRARLRTARSQRGFDPVAEAARTARALQLCEQAEVIAAYAATPGEPTTAELIESLHRRGVRVLLPLLRGLPDWAWYEGPESLRRGARGIPQPSGEPLGAAALGRAATIFVPGLAGTPAGERLGTGGGWYDRALEWAAEEASVNLLLFDEEVLTDLPTQWWDRPVHRILTPERSLTAVRNTGPRFQR